MVGHDKLTPEGKRFFAEIEKLKQLECRVGFQQGAASSDEGVDMCDIALWNELGTVNSPSRPFLRMSVDDNAPQITQFCQAQVRKLANGGTAQEVLNSVGVFGKGLVQAKIGDGSFAPNAPSTIRKKKSDKPLIDTGRMRQSVNYVIQTKGGR